MLNALRWFAKLLAPRRPQPAYAYATKRTLGLALAAALTIGASSASAQVADNQLKNMGLQAMWRTQLQMPIEAGSIVSTHLWTNPNDRKTYAELTLPAGTGYGKRTFRFNASTLGADGKPIGIDAAKHEVEIRAARLLGRSAGVPAVEVTIPMIYLVVVSSDGIVQTLDAETGELLWRSPCGSVTHPAAPASVSDAGVVVAQGDELFLLDWKTGKHLAKRTMDRASTAGVASVGNVAFVASLSGQTAVFDFSKPGQSKTMSYRLFGRTIVPPTSSDRAHDLVAFSTDKGIATLLSGGEKIGPWFNVRSRAPLSGPLTFIGGALYVGDVSGQISKVKLDRTGSVIWRFMIGETLGSHPMVVNKKFYATNNMGELNCADDETGFQAWPNATPRVKSILAGTKERLYCRSLTDRLLVIDTEDGKILSETGSNVIGHDLVNQLDDRLYLISANGIVQCARQADDEHLMPVFHEPLPAATQGDKAKPSQEAPAAEMPAAEAENADPFGATGGNETMAPAGDSDPFAVPATPPAGGNPF
jgi:outer membrane protein assembly factor BamB